MIGTNSTNEQTRQRRGKVNYFLGFMLRYCLERASIQHAFLANKRRKTGLSPERFFTSNKSVYLLVLNMTIQS